MVKRYLSLCSLEEALNLLKNSFVDPSRTELVPLIESLGRIVAAPIYAKYSVPEVNIAAMDGIAVKSRDTLDASDQSPVTLEECTLVNTGNIVPPSFDAVIMIEDTWQDGEKYLIRKSAAPGQHIRAAGEDIFENRLVLPRGHRIRAFDIGALATYGIVRINARMVNVGIIPTGSELVPLGVRPSPGQVVESNTIMAQVFLEAMGAHCTRLPIVRADPDEIKKAMVSAVETNDLVLISAGSSAGTRDYTSQVISSLGELIFHGVAVKPGKPVMLGKINQKPVIGLPGYPLAAQTALREFAAPLLEAWGLAPAPRHRVRAKLATPLSTDIGFDEFVPVTVGRIGPAYWGVPNSRSSGVQMATIKANGYSHIPAPVEGYSAGHELDVFLTTDPASIERTLIFSGTLDPALEELGIIAHDQGMFIHAVNTGNAGALIALKRHACHAAPMNLPASSLLADCPFILPHLSSMDLAFVHIAMIQQGIASHDSITLEDLTSLRYINTRKDSSTRMAFDQLLDSKGIDPSQIDGYHHEVANLKMVAAAIRNGHADAGMCTSGIAKAHGLEFLPLAREQYELAMHREMLADSRICTLISLINSPVYRNRLEYSGAYDTSRTGKIRSVSGDKTECEITFENNSLVLS